MSQPQTSKRPVGICVVALCAWAMTGLIANAQNRGLEMVRAPILDLQRVVGGEDADLGKYPWQVSMQAVAPITVPGLGQLGTGHFCGGSLIEETEEASWVLTAAHCLVFTNSAGTVLKEIAPSEIAVVSGVVELNDSKRLTQTVTDVIPHPDYDGTTSENDIALLRLAPLTTEQASSPRAAHRGIIQFPTLMELDVLAAYSEVTVSGWGDTSEGGSPSNRLQVVNVPVVDAQTCRDSYQPAAIDITDTMVCAGFISGGRDSCQGDSGGPLAARATGSPDDARLVGVVSFGIGCARQRFFGVYTRVPAYLGWIAAQIDSH